MKRIAVIVVLLVLVALGAHRFISARSGAESEAQREGAIAAPQRVVEEHEQKFLRLSEEDLAAGAIVVSEVTPAVVPASAVVWWGRDAWVFVEVAPRKFARTEVTLKQFRPDGYEVEGLGNPVRVVTRGAQLLLSEEERQSIETGDKD